MSIINLLNQIKENSIVLPAIQRGFVWPEAKIEMLMDSIMRGYPIGITLLWETYEDIQYRDFVKDHKTVNKYAFKDNTVEKNIEKGTSISAQMGAT